MGFGLAGFLRPIPGYVLHFGDCYRDIAFAGRRIAATIDDQMTTIWRSSLAGQLKPPATPPSPDPKGSEAIVSGLRVIWRYYVGPAPSAVLIVYQVFTVCNRMIFTAADQAGLACTPTAATNSNTYPRRARWSLLTPRMFASQRATSSAASSVTMCGQTPIQ
jgi:hypothetical protein